MTEPLPTDPQADELVLDETLPHDADSIARAIELSATRLQPPGVVPGYQVVRCIGTGAFGSVWQGVEQNTGKQVAIKFYTQRRGIDWALLNREVEKLAALHTSRDVVGLMQVGWQADPPFYVMEYLANGSLASLLDKRRLTVAEAVRIALAVGNALVSAHDAGILHCDVKPANVLLDGELGPRLADFGQARMTSEQSPALGTLFYMAPEQADLAAEPSARWDVYALGALLYHMIVGTAPFRSEINERRIAAATTLQGKLACYREIVQSSPVPNAHRTVAGVDQRLVAIIDGCLAIHPRARFQSIREVVSALNARNRFRAMRPIFALGFLLPLVLLLILAPLAYRAIHGATQSFETNLTAGTLERNLVIARLLAYSIEDELHLRVRFLEQVADQEDVRRNLSSLSNGDTESSLLPLTQYLTTAREENDAIRREQQLPLDTSWFLTDARGVQRWRSPASDKSHDHNYSWRDYFHGQGADRLDWRDQSGIAPITHSHISVPFRSEVTDELLVAISVPLRRTSDGTVEGVLVRTLKLESLLDTYRTRVLQLDQKQAEAQTTIALIDSKTGLVLDHSWKSGQRKPRLKTDNVRLESSPTVTESLLRSLQELRVKVEAREDPGSLAFDDHHQDPLDESAEERLAAFWPVGGSVWIVAVHESRPRGLQPVRQSHTTMLFYGLAGTVLTMFTMATAAWLVRDAVVRETRKADR